MCQKESWGTHKSECMNLKKIAPRIVPDAARLMARLIVKLQKNGDEERDYYDKYSYRKFKDLMTRKWEKKLSNYKSNILELIIKILVPNSRLYRYKK